MFQIEDVNGHQTFYCILRLHRPHPSTAGVLECHWVRSRPQPLSSPTLALSLIRCNASSVGSGQRRAGEAKQVVDLQVKMDLKQSKGLWKIISKHY